MASSFNKVILVGNVTRDIELRYIPSGTAVADIGLAINERVKKGETWQEETCYVECTAFGRTAEVANEYASKGSPLLIEGRLRFSSWEKDGQKRSKLTVLIDKLQLLGSKSDRQERPAEPVSAGVTEGEADPFEDQEVPF
jgi:single-strand DNA-binding protein